MTATLRELQARLDQRSATAASLAAEALARIEDPRGEGARTMTEVFADSAQRQARASDALREAGLARSALEGIPVSVKDLFDVAGLPTAAGSVVLKSAPPAKAHAPAVQRLLDAGAVLVARTNMTEFAYSGLGINPHHGTPRNPWRREEARIPGGSSSGAAVAISDGMCVASVGSDTGGSCRIPAALCGITGFKPSASRIPQEGMLPLSPTLDAVGVMAADVYGCAAMDAVLSGDAAWPVRPADLHDLHNLRRARFAVPQTLVLDGLSPEVAAAFQAALRRISAAGAELEEIAAPEFLELAQMNAAGGFTAAESFAWHAELIAQQSERYDPRVLSRILRGRGFPAKDYLDLHRQRGDWRQRLDARLAGFDGWLMPTVPQTAPRIVELEANEALYFKTNAEMLRNPSLVNFLDGCALSLPCHAPDAAPVGISLVGATGTDRSTLHWGMAIESVLRS
ncbi:amidase [Ramlibacter sp. 2FC]|uniref:amidase n=1 Tax=Ramlibacter sp. 2FC TaxID=2502188 RepID=UPI0010F842D6|nr:amidase [Ramlibacter sp. 2FC]